MVMAMIRRPKAHRNSRRITRMARLVRQRLNRRHQTLIELRETTPAKAAQAAEALQWRPAGLNMVIETQRMAL